MKSTSDGSVSLILVLIAAFSLFSMIGLLSIDRIVHHDLYRYGLQFSYGWAMPYWNTINFVFAMGWFNIIAAISFEIYILMHRRKAMVQAAEIEEVEHEVAKIAIEPTPPEQQKEQEPKPTETIEEGPKETRAPVAETETKERKEETQTVTQEVSSQGQTETQPEQPEPEPEQVKEQQGPESETEQKETKPEAETQEKSEEPPIIIGVPEEEQRPAISS